LLSFRRSTIIGSNFSIRAIEVIIPGTGSWQLRDCERIIDGDAELADDLRLIHVPGHTRGSIALLHGEVLFTGDHLWATDDQTGLEAGPDVCWYSWPEQRKSIAKLTEYRFTVVLPGHGRRFIAPDAEAMRAAIRAASADV
jgi:glyoxylase-like metal-dependent hydrolase (beta-lactamase superfamily II)